MRSPRVRLCILLFKGTPVRAPAPSSSTLNPTTFRSYPSACINCIENRPERGIAFTLQLFKTIGQDSMRSEYAPQSNEGPLDFYIHRENNSA